ncbi:MAG: prepilin-type N-terminal cleavage/methylation domain-containing protein [Candidatus Zipacnadales bacterium]
MQGFRQAPETARSRAAGTPYALTARGTRVVSLPTDNNWYRGFTLVELLVVLAILVLLFGLLFAPMMTSLDLAKEGQAEARMQDSVSYAMDKIKRTVSNALYILPLETVLPPAAPAAAFVNTSQLVFVEPRRSRDPGTGILTLTEPLQPFTEPDVSQGTAWMEAVRYTVHPRSGRIVRFADLGIDFNAHPPGSTYSADYPSTGEEYVPSFEDPFVLFEQRGIWYEVAPGTFRFGSIDPNTGTFMTNEPSSENALSLGEGQDVACTVSVCDNCGARYPGFRRYTMPCSAPACGATAGYTYLFEGVKFAPQHVAGEQLEPLEDGTVYRAEHGGWAGYANSDATVAPPTLSSSRLDPRIVVLRYDTGTGGYTNLQMDTYDPTVTPIQPLGITWDPDAGAIRFGRFFEQIITLTDSGGSVAGAETPDEATINELEPYGGYTAPSRYQIVPSPAAIILPKTVRVRAIATLDNGETRWMDFVRTEQLEQHQIGEWQFAVKRMLPPASWAPWVPENWALSMEILFNDMDGIGPPSPLKFARALGVPLGTVTSVELHIRYWARRNADIFGPGTPSGRDDIVRVSYYTRSILDISLTLGEFEDYQEDANGNFILPPPPPTIKQASLHSTVVVRNAGR